MTEPDGGYPYILQAFRHGLLQGIVNCGSLLGKLHKLAVEALKHIIGTIMIKYLAYYSFLLGVLDALKEIDHKDIARCIDRSALKPHWVRFEEYLLERAVYKSFFEQSIQSDLSIIRCAQVRLKCILCSQNPVIDAYFNSVE